MSERRASGTSSVNDDARRIGTEEAGRIDEGGLDCGESGHQGLYGEGQAVNDRADDEPIERKGEGMAEEGGDAAADGGTRSEKDEQEEAEDGGRQDEGQGGKGFKSGEPTASAKH